MSDREIVQQCEQLLETVRQLSGQMENQNRSPSPTNINREVAGVFGRASTSTASAGSGSTQQGQQGTSRFRRLIGTLRYQDGELRRGRHRKSKTGTSPVVAANNKMVKIEYFCVGRRRRYFFDL